MVDTRHFDAGFTERLLEELGTDESLDEMTDGVLFHSENFQALRLFERRYRGRVDCVYIDPRTTLTPRYPLQERLQGV